LADVVDPAKRSLMMSGIRSKNTKPELVLRHALHSRGIRYRLHCNDLPGKPDLCLSKYRAVVFSHGCFWHGHDCHLFKWPSTRAEFWRGKIERNRYVDATAVRALLEKDWRVAIVWECALKGRERIPLDKVVDELVRWLNHGASVIELRGSAIGASNQST
jgi:DNA mismatch endonuclease (patch repair protein)